ncbi:hypothetical protein [Pseudodesulfovibrio pelocollis]|uniref:hypothetical protein n=1 Tax=Pseudodesulfovibrio pelocollis TaxID=3051432 RepID=UPI00255AD652|nr:hypothetical protein [Pseudodesulfovibrio sp. SB368]
MSSFTETDLPLELNDGEIVTLADGTSVRFESSGEAKDIMINDGFSPAATLFPGNEHVFEAGGNTYRLSCEFGNAMKIERV